MSESHSETRVLEYPFSTPFIHTKGYLRVLGGGRAVALVGGLTLAEPPWSSLKLIPAMANVPKMFDHVMFSHSLRADAAFLVHA